MNGAEGSGVALVRSYGGRAVRSPTFAMALPSVVVLRDYRRPLENAPSPA